MKKGLNQNLKVTLLIILSIITLLALSWGMGWFGIFYKSTVGKANINADRQIFTQSKAYTEGMISDLANYKYELETEKDIVAKQAIARMIVSKYANFDISKIEDLRLNMFLVSIKNNSYNLTEVAK